MLTRRDLLRTLPMAAGALCGCGKPVARARYRLPKKPLSVVTSTVQAADLVRCIGGEAVTVSSLIPPLANPHLWQPVAADYAKLQMADVFFLSGLGLEAKFTADLNALRNGGLFAGVLANSLTDQDVLKRADGSPDPHFWMDPRLWAKAAAQAADVLTEAYPQAGLWFSDRAHECSNDLRQLHDTALRDYGALPARARFLFSSHDSMAYFGAAYGLQTRSLANSAGETPRQFPEALTSWLSENHVRNLFREHFADAKLVRALARPLNLVSDPQIFSLSLGLPGTILAGLSSETDVGTFLPALRYTLETVKAQLDLA